MYKYGAILKNLGQLRPSGFFCRTATSASQMPSFGSGVGMGSGAVGSVRDLGGAFAQRQAIEEEGYFRRLAAHQLQHLHDLHVEEIRILEKEVKEHASAIERHKQKLRALKKLAEGHELETPASVRVD